MKIKCRIIARRLELRKATTGGETKRWRGRRHTGTRTGGAAGDLWHHFALTEF